MPENWYMVFFWVKEFNFDVKIAKIWLLHGEKLILNFDECPTLGGKFRGVDASLRQKIFFIYIYIAYTVWKYNSFLFTFY